MNLFWFIMVGLIAGWLAEILTKKNDPGLVITIIYGVMGAVIGGFIFNKLNLNAGSGFGSQIMMATSGAVILIVFLRLIRARNCRG